MNINLLDEPLIRALRDENIPFHDVMNAFNIRTQVAFNLAAYIKGFVYISKRGSYYIILNGKLNYEDQCKTFAHEVKHIVEDVPTISYYIGINKQHCALENDCDILNLLKDIV
ncbi:MAG: hypothetical protein AB9856_21065 [Cellulosilyticaceae bacterium]